MQKKIKKKSFMELTSSMKSMKIIERGIGKHFTLFACAICTTKFGTILID